jgi:flavodoxin I
MNTIIIYTSMTGTTELMAITIGEELKKCGLKVDIKDALEISAEELNSYEGILIGSYTWGNGELPDEIVDFYEDLQSVNLSGKMIAIFGAGDSSYDHFARAVDILEETLKSQGCEIVLKGLKVDRESDSDVRIICRLYSEKLIKALNFECIA